MATERITILVNEKGTRIVRRRLSETGDTAVKAAGSVGVLKKALAGLGGAFILRELIRIADTYTNLQNRLRLVTEGTEQLNAVTKELLALSNRTRSSFQNNAELYNRVSLAVRELGIDQKQLVQFTESLNQAIQISGASAKEASTALIQLSQGLASNTLRGDELRSILEQLPAVADVIAKQMGVTRGQLRMLGAEGKISAKIVLEAFKNAREELAERFKKVVPTLGQAWQVLQNQVIGYIGSINESKGASRAVAALMINIAGNVDILVKSLVLLGVTLLSVKLAFSQAATAGLSFNIILAAIRTRIHTITAAIAANPLGALLVGLAVATTALVLFSDKIKLSADSSATLADVSSAAMDEYKASIRSGLDSLRDWISENETLRAVTTAVFGDINFSMKSFLVGAARTADAFVGLFVGVGLAIVSSFKQIPNLLLQALKAGFNGIVTLIERVLNGIIRAINHTVSKAVSLINGLIDKVNTVIDYLPGLNAEIGKISPNIIEEIDFGRLESNFTDAAKNIGKSVADGFTTGYSSITGVQDLLDRSLKAAELNAQQKTTGVDLSKAAAGGKAPTSGGGSPRGLTDMIAKLQKEAELLRLTNEQREVQNDLIKLEQQLVKGGIKVTEDMRGQLETELQRLQLVEQVSVALDTVRGTTVDLVLAQTELNAQIAAGNITLEEAAMAYRELQNAALATSTSVEAGFQKGLNSIGAEIGNFSEQTETTLVNAFHGAEDALVSFVQTGKINFHGLVSSLLADLTRLIARQAMMAVFNSAMGAFGGGFGGLLSGAAGGAGMVGPPAPPGLAGGGSADAGRPYLVGEKGPELFTPKQSGTVTPSGTTKQMLNQAPPQVHVSITNVTDKEDIAASITSKEGERAILNVISRNPKAIQGVS